MNGRKARLASAVFVVLWMWGSAQAREAEVASAEAGDAQEDDLEALSRRIAALDAWQWIVREEAPPIARMSEPVLIDVGDDDHGAGDPYASGIASLAAGLGAYAVGHRSTAVGTVSQTDGEYAVALGYAAWARYDPALPKEQTHQVAIGSHAVAFGQRVVAIGGRATAFAGWDFDTNTEGTSLVAIGMDAAAQGRHNTAVGDSAWALDAVGYSSAFGSRAWATAEGATALGAYAGATLIGATAVGAKALVQGEHGIAVGRHSLSIGTGAIAIGGTDGADTNGNNGVDAGETTRAWGEASVAIGSYALAQGEATLALGRNTFAKGVGAVAAGDQATALGDGAMSIGTDAQATGLGAVTFGTTSAADGQGAFAYGSGAFASGAGAGAIGSDSAAVGVEATALGVRSQGLADNSVALGAGSIADVANTVSIGVAGAERRIVHVDEGVDDTDAANYGQVRRLAEQVQGIGDAGLLAIHYDDASRKSVTLDAGTALRGLAPGSIAGTSSDAINGAQLFSLYDRMASVFGADAAMGVDFTGPEYALDNGTFGDVGSALDALQAQSRVLRDRLDALGGGGTPTKDEHYVDIDGRKDGSDKASNNDVLRSVAIGAGASVSSGASNSVAIGAGSVAARADTVSVGSAGNERQIANVAAGTAPTDAVNVEQMQKANDQVYANARKYVDLRVENALAAPMAAIGELRSEMDDRLVVQDRRIDRHVAMSAAAMNMVGSAAGVRTPHRVAVGAGVSGGEQALSLGYQHAFSDRAALTLGGAFSGDENSAGIGFSFGW